MGRMIINLPRLGETMEEARVTAWIVAPNAAFKRGDVLLEVETDKTVVEVPALQDGVMLLHLVKEGDVVSLEAPIAEIESAEIAAPAAKPIEPISAPAAIVETPVFQSAPRLETAPSNRIAASPAARAVARQLNVPLQGVSGTGRNGRISAHDVMGQKGAKPVVVLLHGLFDNHRGWRDVPQRLMKAGYEVANIDLPGHGDLLPAAKDFDDAVRIITDHIHETLGAKHLIIVGHSVGAALGAGVASKLQSQRTNSVEGLLMLSPAGLGPRINDDFILGMLSASSRASLSRCFALLDTGPISDASLDAELKRLIAERPHVTALVTSVAHNGVQQIDSAPMLEGLNCPVTAIFGLKDKIIDWQDCSHLPQKAAVHFLKHAGHLPHVSAPEFVCQLISALNKLPFQMTNAA